MRRQKYFARKKTKFSTEVFFIASSEVVGISFEGANNCVSEFLGCTEPECVVIELLEVAAFK